MERPVRLLCATVGNVSSQPGIGVKLGHFYKALENHARIVDIYDATLKGRDRLINQALIFHPNVAVWKERFYKNVPAFRLRSKRFVEHARSLDDQIDAVLQIGVLFDAKWGGFPKPNMIYVDYTAHLSAQKPAAGRSPFSARQRSLWLELELMAFQKASYIFARSDLVRTSIIEDYKIAPERVSTVGGGVNFERLPEITRKPRTASPTVLFIGKDFYRKGGDILMQAFAGARKKVPSARLVLVTDGPIPENLPKENVTVVAPTWDRGAIEALYRESDIFVLPSRLETWGDVLPEAMSYGLPCIGVQSDAMGEIVQAGKTGLLVPPEDAESLEAALVPLLQNQEQRDLYGQSGRELVEERFTWERVSESMVEIISAMVVLDE